MKTLLEAMRDLKEETYTVVDHEYSGREFQTSDGAHFESKLENGYILKSIEEGEYAERWMIDKPHPYDNTNYAFAISDIEHWDDTYTVYDYLDDDKEPTPVEFDVPFEDVVEMMSEFDSVKKPNIDRS